MTDIEWALVQLLDGVQRHDLPNMTGLTDDECDRIWAASKTARAALAEPEPEGPKDADLHALAFGFAQPCFDFEYIPFARAVIARWGRPTPQPSPEVIEMVKTLREINEPSPALAGEVAELVGWLREMGDLACQADAEEGQRYWSAADLLERLSPPQPILVSERLPGLGDCDAEGRCWWWFPETIHFCGYWQWEDNAMELDEDIQPVAWLPAHALPLPREVQP